MRLGVLALASCASFEDPTLIKDLRVIAMTATPPDQVLDLDLANPPQAAELIDKLEPTAVCATVADPNRSAKLRWSMTACLPDNGRCDPTRPMFELARGEALDPELVSDAFCAPVVPSGSLLAILLDALEGDTLRGLDGISYSVELRVGVVDDPPELDQFGLKSVRVFARVPETRVPNRNPSITQLQLQTPELHIPALLGCTSDRAHPIVRPRTRVGIVPVELEGTRELYPVLALDGSFEMFDETLTYQYLATAGQMSDQFGGGPRDAFGNEPGLGTTWTAPDFATEAQLWMIQRDERGGVSVYPFCIRVQP
jgi:hypothetical protein